MTQQAKDLDRAFLDSALEEQLGAAQPPDLRLRILAAARGPADRRARPSARRARQGWAAAALIAVGLATVFAVARLAGPPTADGGTGGAEGDRGAVQDPLPAFAEPSGANPFMPLHVGHRWVYREQRGDETADVVVECSGWAPVRGEPVFQLRTTHAGDHSYSHVAATADGVWFYPTENYLDSPTLDFGARGQLVLPTPVENTAAPGPWEWSEPLGRFPQRAAVRGGRRVRPLARFTAALAAADVEVSVPAGTYRAIQVRVDADVDGQRYREDRWYVRDVGLVKIERTEAGVSAGAGQDAPRVLVLRRELAEFAPAAGPADVQKVWRQLAATDPELVRRGAPQGISPVGMGAASLIVGSRFALLEFVDGSALARRLGDRAVRFDPTSVDDLTLLFREEKLHERTGGLHEQSVRMTLAGLAGRLVAAQQGWTVEGHPTMVSISFQGGPAGTSSKVEVALAVQDPDGAKHRWICELDTFGDEVVRVSIPGDGGR